MATWSSIAEAFVFVQQVISARKVAPGAADNLGCIGKGRPCRSSSANQTRIEG